MKRADFIFNCLRRNVFAFSLLSIVFIVSVIFTYTDLTLKGPSHSALNAFYGAVVRRLNETLGQPTVTVEYAMAIFANNTRIYWDIHVLRLWLMPILGFIVAVLTLMVQGGLLGFAISSVVPEIGVGNFLILILPHATIEIPAMILAFSAVVNWQVGIMKLTISAIKRSSIRSIYFKDVLALTVLSTVLFFIAAFIEVFVTGQLYGILYKTQ